MKTDGRSILCILCSRSLEQRSDKNGKPYFVCDECGTQFFIRGALGKERLSKLQSKNSVASTRNSFRSLNKDLQDLQGYIEAFCSDEYVLTDETKGMAGAVPFPEWSRSACERLHMGLYVASKAKGSGL